MQLLLFQTAISIVHPLSAAPVYQDITYKAANANLAVCFAHLVTDYILGNAPPVLPIQSSSIKCVC